MTENTRPEGLHGENSQNTSKKGETTMSSDEKEQKRISRREFVKGAAVGAAGVAAAGVLASCAQEATPCPPCPTPEVIKETVEVPVEVIKEVEVKPWLPEKWDEEADVVVIGAGFAAQAAAIEAHDAGASVLMLEKAPEEYQGGNSRVCGQGFLAPTPAVWDGYFAHFKAMTAGQGFPVPDDMLRLYTEGSYENKAWLEGMGAEVVIGKWGLTPGTNIPFYPQFPGSDVIATEPPDNTLPMELGPGRIWYFLEDQISERKGIRKMYETPAKRLIQDVVTKEILGVVAESGGREIYVKAKRAVCMCCGGYEYNQDMIRNFQGMAVNYSSGGPYNTGDGIKMCMEVGADFWNMHVYAAPTSLAAGILPGYLSAIRISQAPKAGASITVGANNKRWRDEYRKNIRGIQNREIAVLEGAGPGTGKIIEKGVYVRDKYPMPMHIIFDEEARLSGPLFNASFAAQVEGYQPSEDNSTELEMGWIVKADNIRELATKIGRDPDALEETVNRWNESCAAGRDLEFDTGDPNHVPYNRPKELLNPIVGGPLYAVECFPSALNTQGGPKRNTESQVIDMEGKPIPRLYAAGEMGDGVWSYLYQCLSNVGGGCFTVGRIAGKNTAAEEPWD
jgi:succinate dehydrogenase/fumarate reductase flavoprotein subunit